MQKISESGPMPIENNDAEDVLKQEEELSNAPLEGITENVEAENKPRESCTNLLSNAEQEVLISNVNNNEQIKEQNKIDVKEEDLPVIVDKKEENFLEKKESSGNTFLTNCEAVIEKIPEVNKIIIQKEEKIIENKGVIISKNIAVNKEIKINQITAEENNEIIENKELKQECNDAENKEDNVEQKREEPIFDIQKLDSDNTTPKQSNQDIMYPIIEQPIMLKFEEVNKYEDNFTIAQDPRKEEKKKENLSIPKLVFKKGKLEEKISNSPKRKEIKSPIIRLELNLIEPEPKEEYKSPISKKSPIHQGSKTGPFKFLTKNKMKQKANTVRSKLKIREGKQVELNDQDIQTLMPLENFEMIFKSILTRRDPDMLIDFHIPIPELEHNKFAQLLYQSNRGKWKPTGAIKASDIELLRDDSSPLIGIESVSKLKVEGCKAKQYSHKQENSVKIGTSELPEKMDTESGSNQNKQQQVSLLKLNECVEEKQTKPEERVVVLTKEGNTAGKNYISQDETSPVAHSITPQLEESPKAEVQSPPKEEPKSDNMMIISENFILKKPSIPEKPQTNQEKTSPFIKCMLKQKSAFLQKKKLEENGKNKERVIILLTPSKKSKQEVVADIIGKSKLSPIHFSEQISKSLENSQQFQWFSYYMNNWGNIKRGYKNLKLYPSLQEVKPEHVIEMANRFLLDIENDSDLIWIFHQQLCMPMPSRILPNSVYSLNEREISRICKTKLWQHPGDMFFFYSLQHAKKQKAALNISSEERKFKDIQSKSWICFKEYNRMFYFNFATMKKSTDAPEEFIGGNASLNNIYIEKIEDIREDYKKANALMQDSQIKKYLSCNMKKAKEYGHKKSKSLSQKKIFCQTSRVNENAFLSNNKTAENTFRRTHGMHRTSVNLR